MITGILFYFHQISLLRFISGSQLVVWYYRVMGAKIGKGVLLNSLSRWVRALAMHHACMRRPHCQCRWH